MIQPANAPPTSLLGRLRALLSPNHGSSFRRNIIHVMRANALVQILALASMPLLTRLYVADDFGHFAYFSAVAVVAVSVTTLRFDWSIPNAGSSAAAAALFALGSIAILLTCTMALVLITLDVTVLHILTPGLGPWILAVPVIMASLGLVELLNGWFVRASDLKTVSMARIGQGLTNVSTSIAAGLARLGAGGLILAMIAASWASVALLAWRAGELWQQIRWLRPRRIAAVFRRYWRQSALSTAVSLMNATSASVTVILLAMWFSLQELGWYSLMLRLAIVPIGLVSSAIGQSFWARAAELAREKEFALLRSVYLKTTGRLALLGIPILIGCSLGPFLVGPIFGQDEWGPAGMVLLATAPHLLGTAIFSPTNHLVVYGRQGHQLISDLMAIGLITLSIFVSAQLELGIVACTFYVSLSMLISYLVRFFLHLRANSELQARA